MNTTEKIPKNDRVHTLIIFHRIRVKKTSSGGSDIAKKRLFHPFFFRFFNHFLSFFLSFLILFWFFFATYDRRSTSADRPQTVEPAATATATATASDNATVTVTATATAIHNQNTRGRRIGFQDVPMKKNREKQQKVEKMGKTLKKEVVLNRFGWFLGVKTKRRGGFYIENG
jgi:Na+-transporting methylmalonyl-CoA/oxaloacetate decarboxylase gamma subunit